MRWNPLARSGLAGLVVAASLGACEGSDSLEQDLKGAQILEIHALDIWAQPLPEGGFEISLSKDGAEIALAGDDHVFKVPLGKKKARYELRLSAPDHHDVVVPLSFDGTTGLSSVEAEHGDATALHGVTLSHEKGRGQVTHRLFVGLRHKWFSAEGRPARRDNFIDFLMDGESAWSAVHQDLQAADDQVLVSTWWWESAFELVRPAATHKFLDPAERKKNTIMGLLEASPADKRVLVGQLWGQDGVLSGFTVDEELEAHGAAAGDGFEFMGQANTTSGKFRFSIPEFVFADRVRALGPELDRGSFDPAPGILSTVPEKDVDLTAWPISVDVEHASMHQKFIVIDADVAYVGGMNLRKVDWDTSAHAVFDARRMNFDATTAERESVAAKETLPDNGPRKDYMVRIEGPAAPDVADVFQKRWAQAMSDGVEHSDRATGFEVDRDVAPRAGGSQVQVTATLPQPYWEHAIAETWLNAIAQAEQYVFIEDQYFRAPMLNDALFARMTEVPDLKLVVITKPVSEWTDPGCRWTYESAALFADAFPQRFLFLQLRSFDTQVTWGIDETVGHFVDIDVHSKLFIVDDAFMSVGSCNKNNRGMIYEAELNVAVLDRAWVGTARRQVLANVLPSGTPATDDAARWFTDLSAAAQANDAVYARWDDEGFDLDLNGAAPPATYRPAGLVYTLPHRDVSDCLLESVGPDMTGEGPPGGPPEEEDPEGAPVE